MSDSAIEFTLPDADATDALGRALAQSYLRSAAAAGAPASTEGCTVLYLRGELGAGKTSCARSLLRTLGATGLIRSPTYTLVETYALGERTCVHVDLYRVTGAAQVDELGLRDMLTPGALMLIEWPERGGRAVPAPDLTLWLEYASTGRLGRVIAGTPAGRGWLNNLRIDTR